MSSECNPLAQYDSIADRIMLERQVSAKSIIIVEGSVDYKILSRILPEATVMPAGGRPTAVKNLEKVQTLAISSVYAILDHDFEPVAVDVESESRVIYYEKRDLESMLISLGVLDKVIGHYLPDAGSGSLERVHSLVLGACETMNSVARVRAYCIRHRLPVDFTRIDPCIFVNLETRSFSVSAFARALRSKDPESPVGLLESANLDDVEEDHRGPRGKDVVGIIARDGLKGMVATRVKGLNAETLLRNLHFASDYELVRSEWFQEVKRKVVGRDDASVAA